MTIKSHAAQRTDGRHHHPVAKNPRPALSRSPAHNVSTDLGRRVPCRFRACHRADGSAASIAHITLIHAISRKTPASMLKILEAFFLMEEKRAMCTQNFRDLLGPAAYGRNTRVCAAHPTPGSGSQGPDRSLQ
jgi:hypothetical protein